MEWPWKKFEAFYGAFLRREQSEKLFEERVSYITGLLANTNLDDGKQTKARMLENIDIDYQNNLRSVYNIDIEEQVEFDQDPFFKAMKIPGLEPESEIPPVPDRTIYNLEELDVDQGGEQNS